MREQRHVGPRLLREEGCATVGVRENGMWGRRMFAMKGGREGIFTLERIPYIWYGSYGAIG